MARRKKILSKIRKSFEEVENPKKEKQTLEKLIPKTNIQAQKKVEKQEKKSPKELEQEEEILFDEDEYYEDDFEQVPNPLLRRRRSAVGPSLQARHTLINLETDLAEVATEKKPEPESVNYGAFKIGYASSQSSAYASSNNQGSSYASNEMNTPKNDLLDLKSSGGPPDRSTDLSSQFRKEMGYAGATNQQGKYEFKAGGKLEQDTGTPFDQSKRKKDKFGFF